MAPLKKKKIAVGKKVKIISVKDGSASSGKIKITIKYLDCLNLIFNKAWHKIPNKHTKPVV